MAGTGFLVDAYTLFALNVVIPMLGYVYFPEEGKVPRGYQTAMFCATLAGSMIGQVAFGVAADMYGRRRVYGIELMVLIAGSLYLSMSGTGERHSMNIWGWLVTWRLIVGLAVGADYPLSAVITSEFAPRKHRARMLTTVFFFQAVGQTIAQALSIAFIAAWQSRIEKNKPTCQDDDCIRAIDSLWRLVIGLGAVPAAVALAFRYAIPESPRYQMDVLRAVDLTLDDITDYFGVEDYDGNPEGGGGPAVRPSGDQPRAEYTDNPAVGHGGAAAADADTDAAHAAHTTPFDAQISDTTGTVSPAEEMARWRANASRTYTPDDIHLGRLGSSEGRSTANLTMGGRDGDNEADAMAAEAVSRTGHRYSPVQDEAGPEATGPVRQAHNHPPLASKQDAYRFFILERNWIYLAGTSLAWFFLDFAFYGLGYASPTIIRSIWEQPGRELSVYQELLNNSIHSLIVVSIGAVAGGLIIIKMIKHVSPKTIQFWGFLILAVLFVVTGSIWNVVLSNDGTGNNTAILVLYVFIQLFFNMGPNTTTFMVRSRDLSDYPPSLLHPFIIPPLLLTPVLLPRFQQRSSRRGIAAPATACRRRRASWPPGARSYSSPLPSTTGPARRDSRSGMSCKCKLSPHHSSPFECLQKLSRRRNVACVASWSPEQSLPTSWCPRRGMRPARAGPWRIWLRDGGSCPEPKA